ncbi:MAG: hypothetical protein JEY94_08555 [Melioribacteraceae bacterium]|nr:hypothetical protein [Melioribacteraceae bacterium]
MKTLMFLIITFAYFHQVTCQVPDNENKALDEFISKQIKIEADVIKSAALEHILDALFFNVKRIPLYKGDNSYNEMVLMKNADGIKEFENTDMLIPIIKEDIKLNNEAVAKQFQKVFTLLFKNDIVRNQEIINKDNQWIFVQGEWFGKKTGYIVKTDSNGKVQEIEKSEELKL